MGNGSDFALVSLVIVGRFLLPLLIPRWPLPGVVACLLLDAADQTIFQAFTAFPLERYQSYDKALDVYYLVIAYLTTLRNWDNQDAFEISRFLIYYRLVGAAAFELTGWRPLLLIFANTFEYFFIFYEVARSRWTTLHLSRKTLLTVAASIWILIKLPQEYWIHVAQLDVTDTLKRVAGVGEGASLVDSLATRPIVLVVALVAVAALVLVARFLVWPRLPDPEHKLELAAAALPSNADEAREQRAIFRGTRRPFDRVLLEKIALTTLVSLIFAQILPGFNTTPLRLALTVATVVSINSAASYWFATHDLGWGHVAKQFGLMSAVNASLGLLAYLLPPNGGLPVNVLNTLFLLLLLTLLVTFYDVYRPIHWARLRTAEQAPSRRAPHAAGPA